MLTNRFYKKATPLSFIIVMAIYPFKNYKEITLAFSQTAFVLLNYLKQLKGVVPKAFPFFFFFILVDCEIPFCLIFCFCFQMIVAL